MGKDFDDETDYLGYQEVSPTNVQPASKTATRRDVKRLAKAAEKATKRDAKRGKRG